MSTSRERAYLSRLDVVFLTLRILSMKPSYMAEVSRTAKKLLNLELTARTLSRLGSGLTSRGWVTGKVDKVGRGSKIIYKLTRSGHKELARRWQIYEEAVE